MLKIMSCPEKEILQHRCTTSLNAFESALNDLGVVLDPSIGDLNSRLFQGFSGLKGLSDRQVLLDPQTGTLSSPYRDAFSLLKGYSKACSLLNKHLHTHRC